jgi:hypothetical protein
VRVLQIVDKDDYESQMMFMKVCALVLFLAVIAVFALAFNSAGTSQASTSNNQWSISSFVI